jgi:Trp operon repressor
MILAELIHGKKPQREIAANLNVSIFNVTRGANQLKSASISDKKLIKAPKE